MDVPSLEMEPDASRDPEGGRVLDRLVILGQDGADELDQRRTKADLQQLGLMSGARNDFEDILAA